MNVFSNVPSAIVILQKNCNRVKVKSMRVVWPSSKHLGFTNKKNNSQMTMDADRVHKFKC